MNREGSPRSFVGLGIDLAIEAPQAERSIYLVCNPSYQSSGISS